MPPTVQGIGLGLRRSFAEDLLTTSRRVDWLEITPENWMGLGGWREDIFRRCAERWPLAVASSSNPELIEVVLERAGIRGLFLAVVSSQDVPRGKPAPDVYLEASRRLGVEPERCAAVEDSHNGIRSAKAAGMRVVAVPNVHFPPDAEALGLADTVVRSVGELTPGLIESLGSAR